MAVELEAGDYAQAATVAEQLDPRRIPSLQSRAAYWATTAERSPENAPRRYRLGSTAR